MLSLEFWEYKPATFHMVGTKLRVQHTYLIETQINQITTDFREVIRQLQFMSDVSNHFLIGHVTKDPLTSQEEELIS